MAQSRPNNMVAKMIKPEWFNGNKDAIEFYQNICVLADVWDNMIDRDKPVTNAQINDVFLTCLYRLPLNPVYRHLEQQIAPMWLTVISAYETANKFEEDKEPHGIELAHNLRYAAGHIIGYVMTFCLGIEGAKKYIPEMWKTLANERFDVYREEHLGTEEEAEECAE